MRVFLGSQMSSDSLDWMIWNQHVPFIAIYKPLSHELGLRMSQLERGQMRAVERASKGSSAERANEYWIRGASEPAMGMNQKFVPFASISFLFYPECLAFMAFADYFGVVTQNEEKPLFFVGGGGRGGGRERGGGGGRGRGGGRKGAPGRLHLPSPRLTLRWPWISDSRTRKERRKRREGKKKEKEKTKKRLL